MAKKKDAEKNQKDISNIAVVYARYSSSGQREESIDGQLAAARKYAEAKGYTIIHEYIDRAKTGRNDNREDFQRMLLDTKTKTFSIIIVWKVDRFGRNREEVMFNKHHCKKNGVHVEYVAEHVPDGPEGVILESLLEGMAEYFSLQLSQNVKRGLRENAKQHKAVTGTPPLGYRLTPDKHYEIDPNTAPIVKVIFERYAAGESLFDLIRYLNTQGYKTVRGGKFQRSSLDKTLKNEMYIGVYTFKEEGDPDYIRDEDAVPAIVDKDTFEKVQDMLQRNKRTPSNNWSYADYILTGKLFCGECGEVMVGKAAHGKTKVHNYYACQGHLKKHGCEKQAIRQDVIEPLIMDEVMRLLADDELLEFIAERTWQFYLDDDIEKAERDALQSQLAENEKATKNLLRAVEDGLPYDTVRERIEQLNGEKTALEKALAEMDLAKGPKLTKDHILFFLEQLRDLNTSDVDCQKRLIQTFVNALYLYDDGTLKVAYNFTNSEKWNNTHIVTREEIEQAEKETCEHPENDSVRTLTVKRAQVDAMRTPTLELLPRIYWTSTTFILTYRIPARKSA